jgi:hypothetical protein
VGKEIFKSTSLMPNSAQITEAKGVSTCSTVKEALPSITAGIRMIDIYCQSWFFSHFSTAIYG